MGCSIFYTILSEIGGERLRKLKKVLSVLLICAIFGATIPVQAQSEERKQTVETIEQQEKSREEQFEEVEETVEKEEEQWGEEEVEQPEEGSKTNPGRTDMDDSKDPSKEQKEIVEEEEIQIERNAEEILRECAGKSNAAGNRSRFCRRI